MHLTIAIVAILLINVIFGYWRANTRKFSWQWIMAIHIPVPIAIGLRFLLLGWSLPLIPVFVVVFAAGQYIGGKIRKQLSKQQAVRLSSCFVLDVFRIVSLKRV